MGGDGEKGTMETELRECLCKKEAVKSVACCED